MKYVNLPNLFFSFKVILCQFKFHCLTIKFYSQPSDIYKNLAETLIRIAQNLQIELGIILLILRLPVSENGISLQLLVA